jgi:hypothetical protein
MSNMVNPLVTAPHPERACGLMRVGYRGFDC